MRSIRTRLLIALILLVALISALAGWVTYHRVLVETSTIFDYQLRQMALSLRSRISAAPRLELPSYQNDADFVVQIWDADGARVYLSRPGLPVINQAVLGYADLSLNGEGWRAYGLQSLDGVIQVAQPLLVRETLARRAALRVLIPLLLLLPFLIGAVAAIVRAGLGPLRNIAAEVKRRDAGSLEPLVTRELPDEVEPMVAELNRLLARLQQAFATQRAFISDAAHELRSPLTALRLQLQLMDRAPDAAAREAARSGLGAAIERAIHLVEQLLALARSEPSVAASEFISLDLAAAASQAVADMHALATTRKVDLSLESPAPVPMRGDAEAVRTLARNLIDNAVRYTPPRGRVCVSATAASACVVLEVEDSGPGIAPADRERIFDRFYRRALGTDTGTGLGLAIVKAIAERHRAHIELADVEPHGLHVTVRFPAA